MARQNLSSGTRWETEVGYSRAVRIGPMIVVAGTTATDAAGNIVGIGDAGAQAEQCLANIGQALERVGGSLADVIRTRIYVRDIDDWPRIGAAHRAAFSANPPAATMVEVSRFVAAEMLVEIEAEAWLESDRA